jgi:hypothetical protein
MDWAEARSQQSCGFKYEWYQRIVGKLSSLTSSMMLAFGS